MTLTQLTITVPVPQWISSNGREHFHERARRSRAIKAAATWMARSARAEAFTVPVEVVAVVHRGTGPSRRRDAHNLAPSVKAALDGIVLAGVLPDDSDEWVRSLTIVPGPDRPRDELELLLAPAQERAS